MFLSFVGLDILKIEFLANLLILTIKPVQHVEVLEAMEDLYLQSVLFLQLVQILVEAFERQLLVME
jgi:hypothetical protein